MTDHSSRFGKIARPRRDAQTSYVRFAVGDVAYALDVASVREIVVPAALIDLPHVPFEVLGVFDHRGEVVPIVSMRRRFGLPDAEPTRAAKWVLTTSRGRTIGLACDAVRDVFSATVEGVREAPVTGGDDARRGVAFAVTHEGRLVFVLDLARLLASIDLALVGDGRASELP